MTSQIEHINDREELIALLRQWSAYPDSEAAIISALQSSDQSKTLMIFERLIDDNDPWLRNIAQLVLMRFNQLEGLPLLVSLFDRSDSEIRLGICYIFADFGDARAVTSLLIALQSDPDADVRYMAAVALGYIGDARALSALQHAADNDKGKDYEGDPVARAAQRAIDSIQRRQTIQQ